MYCDLCSNRTTNAYCPNRGCRKFTKSKGRGADKKTVYDVNYPSDGKSLNHLLSFTGTEQYGAGGWEAQPREVWVMIRKR
jgi:hypothetical protein